MSGSIKLYDSMSIEKEFIMIHLYNDEIITAIATGSTGGGIGIVRLSGEGSVDLVNPLFSPKGFTNLGNAESHKFLYGHLVNPSTQLLVDEVMVVKMLAPASYTKEDVVEIHCHGGRVAMEAVLSLMLEYGARLADPGEFTKRAFLNGRLDLTQAEAVMEVVSAKTNKGLELSVNQLKGRLQTILEELDNELVRLLSDMEANIDYPEYDIEEISSTELSNGIDHLVANIDQLIQSINIGKIYRDGIPTAIIGLPNVGKSSLLNVLLNEERAIVTDIPGTTRDIIEEYLNIQGVPFRVIDTAGIRETKDVVEQIGVKRSLETMNEASLVLFLLDVSRETSPEEIELMEGVKNKNVIYIANKNDLESHPNFQPPQGTLSISLVNGQGVHLLEKEMVKKGIGEFGGQDSDILISNARQGDLLKEAKEHLMNAKETMDLGFPLELISTDLTNALESIRKITGRGIGTDIIDEIFAKFCLGK